VRIDKLKKEIKEVLSLSELPDVLPFNARLLYRDLDKFKAQTKPKLRV
jgi:hypothetical protein